MDKRMVAVIIGCFLLVALTIPKQPHILDVAATSADIARILDAPKEVAIRVLPVAVSQPGTATSYSAPVLQVSGTGCLDTNVTSAHNHSPGLQNVVIPPGTDWSFNEHWNIAPDLVNCPGQGFSGGGVCNQASRYSNVARALGLQVQSQYHGFIYDTAVPREDNLAIMSSGGRGGQDLVIRNDSNRTVLITAVLSGGQLFVSGGFSD
jgi:hypothetical protein